MSSMRWGDQSIALPRMSSAAIMSAPFQKVPNPTMTPMKMAPFKSYGFRLARILIQSDMVSNLRVVGLLGLICLMPTSPNSSERQAFDLSVVVPTFNARARARATAETLHAGLAAAGLRAEIVIVDDGSRAAERPDASSMPETVRVVQLDSNCGKGRAVRTGLGVSEGGARIFTDVDLPYGIESVVECARRLNHGDVDFIFGDRSLPESKRLSHLQKRRRISSIVFRSAVLSIAGIQQPDTQCGIKGMRDRVAKAMIPRLRVDGFAFDVEMFRFVIDNHLSTSPMAVRLTNGDASTVRLIRDSAAMVRDLALIRARAASGHYRLEAGQLNAARVGKHE
jgi:dolichyl-phosphate beta-glucosyltransferase